jgi:hypothetical protein
MPVFISHSRENAGAALKLAEHLRGQGVDPWLDMLQIESGEQWHERVAAAVASADALVILIGPSPTPDASQRFEWQHIAEHEYYLDPAKAVVPVVIGSADLPGFLKTRSALSVPPSGIDFDALAAQVVNALGHPAATIDHEQMKRGQHARQIAMKNLEEYSKQLAELDVKQAPLRIK